MNYKMRLISSIFLIAPFLAGTANSMTPQEAFENGKDFGTNDPATKPSTQKNNNITSTNTANVAMPAPSAPGYVPGYDANLIPNQGGIDRNTMCVGKTQAQIDAMSKQDAAECNAMKAIEGYTTIGSPNKPVIHPTNDPMLSTYKNNYALNSSKAAIAGARANPTLSNCVAGKPAIPGFAEVRHCTEMLTTIEHDCTEKLILKCTMPPTCRIEDKQLVGSNFTLGEDGRVSFSHNLSWGLYTWSHTFEVNDPAQVGTVILHNQYADDFAVAVLTNSRGSFSIGSTPVSFKDIFEEYEEVYTPIGTSYDPKRFTTNTYLLMHDGTRRPVWETNGRESQSSSTNLVPYLAKGTNTITYKGYVYRGGGFSYGFEMISTCKVTCVDSWNDMCAPYKRRLIDVSPG